MKRLKSVLFLLCLWIPLVYSQEIPKREFRGAWFPTVTNTTWKNMSVSEIKADIINYLDLFKNLNINAVIFQVRPQADAMFISVIEPWSRFLRGEQGVAPDPLFDPAEFITEECHKRGMEMHAWFNPYRVTSNKNEVLSKNHLYFKRPDLFVSYGNQLYFNPGEPEAREHTIRVIADFVSRYDIDAVHFDDYFYPYKVPYSDYPDEETFRKYHEKDGFSIFSKDDWRRNNINILIRELDSTIKEIKPWVKFGISPFGVWRNKDSDPAGSETYSLQTNYDDLYADILLWLKKGWIDYVAPQIYCEIGHKRADYLPLIKWWTKNNYGVNLYIGQNIKKQISIKNSNGDTVNQLYRKMALVRENHCIGGNIWWNGLSFPECKELMDSLKMNYQKYPSFVPLYKSIDSVPPEPLSELTFKRGVLQWRHAGDKDPMQQPHFYCIYKFKTGEETDLEDPSHILAITGKTELYAGKERKVKYLVTVLDRLQNESLPLMITVR